MWFVNLSFGFNTSDKGDNCGHNLTGGERMKKYVCTVCGYVYDEAAGDPDNGVAAGTKWEDVPADWVCPLCGVSKEEFELQ